MASNNPFSVLNTGGGTWGQPTNPFPATTFQNFDALRAYLAAQSSGAVNGNVAVNTLPNGTPQVRVGGTTLDKLLNALSTNLAIIKGAGYIPTTQQPQDSTDYAAIYAAQQYARQQQGGTGATFGATLEQFVTQNTGLLLIAGLAFVLFKSGRK